MGAEKLEPLRKPRVFNYLDYRRYLLDYYHYQKTVNPTFSYPEFARRSQMKSLNYMKLIICGKRNLTNEAIRDVAIACELDKAEAQYFALLIKWTNSKTPSDQEQLWEELLQMDESLGQDREFNVSEIHILVDWQSLALLEMARLKNFKLDPKWVQNHFVDRISIEKVTKIFKRLEDVGLIKRVGEEFVVTDKNVVVGGRDLPSQVIQMYHQNILLLASRTIKRSSVENREYVSTTLSINPEKLKELKAEIRRFNRRVLELSSDCKDANAVYQFNMQLFPLIKEGGGDGKSE